MLKKFRKNVKNTKLMILCKRLLKFLQIVLKDKKNNASSHKK